MVAVQITSTQPATAWLMSASPPNPQDPTKPSVLDVWQMMLTVASAGYVCLLKSYAPANVTENGVTLGDPTFLLTVTRDGFPDQLAPVGSWVVFDGTYATVLSDKDYQAKYAPAP